MAPFWQQIVHPALQEKAHWLRQNSIRSCMGDSEVEAHFVPPARVYQHFTHQVLASILQTLQPDIDANRLAFEIQSESRCYVRVFLILLCLDQTREIDYFLGDESLGDSHLPYSSKPDDFPMGLDWESLNEVQQAFSPPTMHPMHAASRPVRFAPNRILPIEHKETVKIGERADVYKITISQDLDKLDPEARIHAEEPHVYILKAYHNRNPESIESYKREAAAYDKLATGQWLDSLARCYCTFTYRGTSYIVLEYANCGTLDHFMKHVSQPIRAEDSEAVCQGVLRLGQSLEKLHTIGGLHQDIHPLNIVVSKRKYAELFGYTFKLVDFGKTRFNIEKTMKKDSYGTGTYQAPETYRIGRLAQGKQLYVSEKIDVWSLGSVWLEVVVWLIHGWNGVLRFRDERLAEVDQVEGLENIELFHDGAKMLGCVRLMMENIRASSGAQNSLASDICNCLIMGMLHHNVDLRMEAKELWSKSLDIFATANPTVRHSDPNIPVETLNQLELSDPAPGILSTDASPAATSTYEAECITSQRGLISGVSAPPSLTDTLPGNLSYRGLSWQKHRADGFLGPIPATLPYWRQQVAENSFQRRNYTTGRAETICSEPGVIGENSQISRSQTQRKTGTFSFGQNGNSLLSRSLTNPTLSRYPQGPEPLPEESGAHDAPDEAHRNIFIPKLSVLDLSSWTRPRRDGRRPQLRDEQCCRTSLRDRDHIFILDNTWNTAPYYSEMCELLFLLSSVVEDCDPDGSDLLFSTTNKGLQHEGPEALCTYAENIRPEGRSNLQETLLDKVVGKYENQLKEAYTRNAGHHRRVQDASRQGRVWLVRPISVYIFTTGIWDSGNPEIVCSQVQMTLKTYGLTRKQIGFQFIRFGDSVEGKARCDLLDDSTKNLGSELDIVDTEPFDGNVWKQLLGPIDDRFDNSS